MNIPTSDSASPQREIERAGQLLMGARAPVLVVDQIDLAGAAAAVELARQTGAVLDHVATTGLAPAQEQGTLGSMPGEAYRRADLVVVAGPIPESMKADPAFKRLLAAKHGRNVVALGGAAADTLGNTAERFSTCDRRLSEEIGILNAVAQGKPVAIAGAEAETVNQFTDRLKSAKYGVFVFSSEAIDFLEQTALMALANTLSGETRWSVLALGRPAGQAELIRMCQALTGLPPPISFAGARAIHDPILFRAPDVVSRREADLVVWISGTERHVPDRLMGVPLVALTTRTDTMLSAGAQITIGKPGLDHAALSENETAGYITARQCMLASGRPSSAQALRRLAQWLSSQRIGESA